MRKLYGMEWPIFTFFAVVILLSGWMGVIPNQLIGGIAVLFTLGIALGELGERIPIWNKYCGGGAILTFLVCGVLVYFDIMPQNIIDISKGWMNEYSFLNVFIAILIVGSLLGIDRTLLMKSSAVFIPTILAGIIGSGIFGVIGGLIFNIEPIEILTAYVLPIMGGGAGAGAIPMAQVYADVTGADASGYLSFSLAILAVANIVAVGFAVALNIVANFWPKLSGNGELVKKGKKVETREKEKLNLTMDDIAAGIFLTAGFFVLAQLVSKEILPSVFGVAIPNFAYLIIFATLANIFNLIPENLKQGAQKCQQFCSNKLVWIQMAGVGITLIDFDEMLSVLSFNNLIIVILIILGAVLGSGWFGHLVGFFAIESSITAGLCMANMGGAGDLAVLGAAKRMDLMSYAQISSRIGGAIILLIGSIIFQFIG
ncbi:damage-inducible protein CinA [Candidatus Epulonipiscium fishelsonii]|uniref:Damage-inducible protein CinA n=1 Tax=Candidatus Epulonipiscium fishelsonii TaxID=77094 RepID=A0ACC8XFF1_9FIRM|nr:damage-inducible protein CinA [Epulopiscium sp. SCG-B05WGA-EpuloA1]ONI41884.1 damage-inducible protein CinA [Epulopiscium sp. SCG-B11WGA-EpuloA1]